MNEDFQDNADLSGLQEPEADTTKTSLLRCPSAVISHNLHLLVPGAVPAIMSKHKQCC